MRILIATGIYPPDIGGPATYSKLLHDELPRRGIAVSVASFGEVRHKPKALRHFSYFLRVVRASRGCDLIFAQDTVSAAFPAMLAAKLTGKRFFVRVPGDYAWEQSVQRFGVTDTIDAFQSKKFGWKAELLRRIQQAVVNGAERVITPSMYFKELVSKWVKNSAKVQCIYNGIDLTAIPTNGERPVAKPSAEKDSMPSTENDSEPINRTARSTRSAQKKNAPKFQPKTIISAGRLVPWKGFVVLIEMLADLPGWKLSIVGDGPIRGDLESAAARLGVSDRVSFLGMIPRADLISLIQASEAFVLNTAFESFSFQVVEAMAAGTPVITTNIGNLTEIVDDGVSGILVAPDDTQAIVAAIKRLSSDSGLRAIMIAAARTKAEQFSIERTLDGLVKAFIASSTTPS